MIFDILSATFPGVLSLEDIELKKSISMFVQDEIDKDSDNTIWFVVSDVVIDVAAKKGRDYRGVWFNNNFASTQRKATNIQDLKTILTRQDSPRLMNGPNFTVISIRQLLSILSYSAIVDHEFVLNSEEEYSQLAVTG